MRKITYAQAINEATHQAMEKDDKVFVIGQGCLSPWYVGDTTKGLVDKFGEKRVIDTPVSEAAITGVAIGAAMSGTKPILIFPRLDFMYLALDQIINQAANWHYMFGGKVNVPIVIRGIINRGGEQGAQHSQAIQAIFSHIPGLKVVMPSNPYDAKGLLGSAIEDPNPVIYIDDRWLYDEKGEVPEEIYTVPIGKGNILKEGKDVTIVAVSYMVKEALEAVDLLRKENIQAEVIDIRSTKPLDQELILKSVKKTQRLVIADTGWKTGGISAEIAKRVYNNLYKDLKAPIEIVALPDLPAPASKALEKVYYPGKDNIIKTVKELFNS
ncbi:alpha-ketoacid dehydrogenase subunit beta [Patescibacteria group bacterium]|nr:alpha-ketoacid dehydrogenase subunit beta [Patescibacteria group bacterium]